MESMRIIFMGTPDFAVPSLQILCDHGFEVVAVVTSPDKPAGRGLQIQESPVKKFAVSRNIPVLQPEKLKDPEFLAALRQLKADIQVVVAFRMLPEVVWNMPRLGTLNLHASLLPDYRGAAPINHAIINGETKTGVTTFFLQHAIDTGDIILQESVDIGPSENAGSLHDRLMMAGAGLVLKTIQLISEGGVNPVPQKGDSIKKAPKIFKADCRINWDQSALQVYNFIRGLSPYPAAWTTVDQQQVKLLSVHIEEAEGRNLPIAGSMETDGNSFMRFAASDNWIYVDELQWEGKKRMPVADFLRGYRIK